MGQGRWGKSLAIFIVLMFLGGVAAGLVAFSIATALYPGPGVGQLCLVSAQASGDILSSSIVATLNNTGGRALVLEGVSVLGVNYTLSREATGVPAVSGWWGFVVDGANSTTLGAGKTGTLYINSSGRVDPAQPCQVRVVATDGTLLLFNATRT